MEYEPGGEEIVGSLVEESAQIKGKKNDDAWLRSTNTELIQLYSEFFITGVI